MEKLILSDLYRYTSRTDKKAFFASFIRIPGFRFSFFYRKVKSHSKYSFWGIVYRYFFNRYTFKYGFQIPKEVSIGKGLQIMHFGSIVVNSQTIIGDNCYLSHGITIGKTNRGKKQGVPTIGNQVYLGAGAAIVGGITIGDNVMVAPNAFINFDVPSNSLVIGNPGVIISKEDATHQYLVNLV